MTIAEAREKCNVFIRYLPRDVLIVAVLVLASSASFGLGYLAGIDANTAQAGQGNGLTFESSSPIATTSVSNSLQSGQVIASKNGTKYYFSSCAGANKISDANKIRFSSPSVAEAAGYTLAANCKNQ